MFSSGSLRVLVVEDDADYADFLRRLLAADRRTHYEVEVATTLGAALERMADDDPDAVVLDLGLPDSDGLRTVRQVVEADLDAALIVLTGVDDQDLAERALALGAQEFLVKDQTTSATLSRAVRYGVDRQRLLVALQEARRAEAHERELRKLERLAGEQPLVASAAMYGARSLAEREPERIAAMQAEYARLLDVALTARVMASEDPNEDLRTLAQTLGFHGATPRDVVVMHARALRDRMLAADGLRRQAYLDEGRVLVLELMGHLAAWYRLGAGLGGDHGQRPDLARGGAG